MYVCVCVFVYCVCVFRKNDADLSISLKPLSVCDLWMPKVATYDIADLTGGAEEDSEKDVTILNWIDELRKVFLKIFLKF